MNNLPYTAGTVTVASGARIATGTGTVWEDARVQPFGFLVITETAQVFIIESIDSPTQLTLLAENAAAAIEDAAYTIISFPSEMQDSLNIQAIRAFLARASITIYLDRDPTAGDGVDGTAALVVKAGAVTIWTRSAGAWNQQSFAVSEASIVAGLGYRPREILAADRVYYVRKDGNDGNDGLADSAGRALLTIQEAVNRSTRLDTNNRVVYIRIGAGTYAEAVVVRRFIGGGTIDIRSTSGVAGDVRIEPPTGSCILVLGEASVTRLTLKTVDGMCLSVAGAGSNCYYGGLVFDGAGVNGNVDVGGGATAAEIEDCTLTGDCGYHVLVRNNAQLQVSNRVLNIVGSPVLGSTFAFVSDRSALLAIGWSKTGATTGGTAYYVGGHSSIQSAGASANFPGGAGYVDADRFGYLT